MRLLVVRKGGFSSLAQELDAWVQFDGEARMPMKALKFSSIDRKMTIYSVNLPMEEFQARQLAKSVSIQADGSHRTFALEFIPPLLKELEKCRADLLQIYNADRSKIREGARPVKPLSEIYSPEDYPSAALQKEDQGTVAISLLVDETGKVVDCSVDSSAGVATLDTMSCYLIQERAKFTPAIGIDGKPHRSTFNQRIKWRLRR